MWTVVWTCAPSFLSLVTILKKPMLRLPQKKTVYEVLPSVEHARRHAQRTTYARQAVGDGQQRGSDAGQLVLLGVRPADQQQWIPLCNRRGRGAVRLTVLDGGNGASLLVKRGLAARRQLLLDVRQRCIAARALVMKIRAGCARRLRAGMCFSSAAAPPRAAAGLTRREAPGCSQSAAPAQRVAPACFPSAAGGRCRATGMGRSSAGGPLIPQRGRASCRLRRPDTLRRRECCSWATAALLQALRRFFCWSIARRPGECLPAAGAAAHPRRGRAAIRLLLPIEYPDWTTRLLVLDDKQPRGCYA